MKLKIGSLNTWLLQVYEERLNDIVKLIIDNDIDIMCFQEMTKSAIQAIARDTGMTYIFRFGNGIVTRLPILEYKLIGLSGYRGAIKAKIKISKKRSVNIIVTHLDHLKESTRMFQIQKLQPHFENAHFLIGDMNALNGNDYGKRAKEGINSRRLKAKLEKYNDEVVSFILSEQFNVNKFICPTCPYGTRVDYIFFKQKILDDMCLSDVKHEVIDTINTDVSDHNMLIMDMKTESSKQ